MNTIDIKRGTPLHQRITTAIKARVDLSKHRMRDRYAAWAKAEDEFMAYMPTSQADQLREDARNAGKPQYTDIIVPYGYASLMAAHTYWSSVFLSRNPILQYMGRHGEGEMNIQAVEALMEYQVTVGGMLPPLYVWLMDAGKYGIGVIGNHWEDETHYVSEIAEEPVLSPSGHILIGHSKKVKRTRAIKGYEGNKLFNVRPSDYIPDPRVPLTNPNAGEFAGRYTELSHNDLIKGKLDGKYIKENVDYVLQYMSHTGNTKENEGSANIVLPDTNAPGISPDSKSGLVSHISVVELVVEIIPKLWGLGKFEYPEKYVFVMTNDAKRVLLQARPFGMWHNKFPYNVIECEVDGYSLFKRSILDVARPMNNILSWLFNSHFHNVRKSLNGEIIFDPSRVNAKDVLDPSPGKRIRIKPEAYGQDVRTFIHTLQPDSAATQTHLRDFNVVVDLMQKVLGVSDNVMGALSNGGRKSATEVRQANTSSVTRLKTQSEYFSATGFGPLASVLLQNTQQLYSSEQRFRIAGSLANGVQDFVNVNADLIAGAYDYIPVDGTLPVDRLAMVNMWSMLLGQAGAFPQFTAQYDVGKIIAWIAQLGGIKNMKQFKIQVMDPEVIASMQARGQLEAIPGGNSNLRSGAGGGPSPAGSLEDLERSAGRVPDSSQLGGMGRTV